MTTLIRSYRTLALAAVGFVASSIGHAQTWDLDACTSGTKAASGYTGCRASGTTATLDIKAYSSTGATTNFTTASTSINNGGTFLGVWSGNEGQAGSTATQIASRDSPHHAIDNFGAYGSSYELVHLNFSKAVDLGTLVAQWANSTGTGDADFQVYRWNYNAGAAPTITNFNPNNTPSANTTTGWSLVHTGDFDSSPGTGGSGPGSLSQIIQDTNYYSSHWLVSTAFGGNNDAFKLGSLAVVNVCTGTVTNTGGCNLGSTGVPEPATMAMVLLAVAGASVTRRRRQNG